MNLAATHVDPSVAGVPDGAKPVVVYDGQCRFCLKQVDRLRGRDEDEVFDYVPRQAEGLEARYPKLADGDFNTGLRLIRTDGTLVVGADAIYQIARHLRGYRRLAWLYRVPGIRWLLRLAYGWVAKNRYKLAGRAQCEDGSCKI